MTKYLSFPVYLKVFLGSQIIQLFNVHISKDNESHYFKLDSTAYMHLHARGFFVTGHLKFLWNFLIMSELCQRSYFHGKNKENKNHINGKM